MKFECSIDIDAPIGKVVALFNDPGNFAAWQNGFISYEPISGIPRTQGAKSKVTYINGQHKIELTETIQVMDLPAEMTALYQHRHGENTMVNTFKELPGGKTRYTTGVGYMKAIGILPKLMAWLMPGMAKKHNQKWLDQFKAFVEKA
jgi:carbon monoxide dehydrogenase subunit G